MSAHLAGRGTGGPDRRRPSAPVPQERTRRTGARAARVQRVRRSGGPVAPRSALVSVLRAVGFGLSTGLVLLVAALAVVLIVVPKATGSMPLTVLTQSMEPTLPPGTLVVVRPVATDQIEVGDVVTYQITSGQAAVVTHRVIAVSSSSDGGRTFTTKGDNNAVADSRPVLPAQIRGTVWYSLPALGTVDQFVNGSRSWLIPSAAVLLLGYAAVMITVGSVSTVRRRRAARAAPAGSRRAAGRHR
ncbi:signal peptidase I [Curtobacterium herbarum]|uniref:signal peptidase I n=1 Tax=Curtobacterium herbarum TaxID=150122 RepID=UPI00217CE8DE|nr:signal peptidase I [Curtobacterium herbarum]MBM7474662.1 signal peptidase [Curtobacterium herbarum]MCS6545315.1 signal peptidase I [Curtobacterium herbarum]